MAGTPRTPTGPPAGWYEDPNGQPVLRWWDGQRWSEHTQPAPGPGDGLCQRCGSPETTHIGGRCPGDAAPAASPHSQIEGELEALKREVQAAKTTEPPGDYGSTGGRRPLSMIPPPPSRSHRFNPPPGWPPPPPNWVPPATPWDPGPSSPPAPENWQWWIPRDGTAEPAWAQASGGRNGPKTSRAPMSRQKKVIVAGAIAVIVVIIIIAQAAAHSGGGQAASSSGGMQARKLAACYGTDGYGNAETMVSADTLQQCGQFVSQLAEAVHPGLLPGGTTALDGTQCTMIAAHSSQEPFSVVVGQNAPGNLCSLLAQDGYLQS